MKLKYIIFDHIRPVIFGDCFGHADIRANGKPTSAGFVSLQEIDAPEDSSFCQVRIIKASCYGESIGLGLKSLGEEDAHIIDRVLNR